MSDIMMRMVEVEDQLFRPEGSNIMSIFTFYYIHIDDIR